MIPEVRLFMLIVFKLPTGFLIEYSSEEISESIRRIAFNHGMYQHLCFKAIDESLRSLEINREGNFYGYELIGEGLELLEKPREAEVFRRKARGEGEEEKGEGEKITLASIYEL